MSKTKEKITPTFENRDPGDENVEDTDKVTVTPKIAVGLSPLGGIGLNVTDSAGVTAGIMLSNEEAEQLGGRLLGLASILLHTSYIQAAQEAAQAAEIAKKIHLPS